MAKYESVNKRSTNVMYDNAGDGKRGLACHQFHNIRRMISFGSMVLPVLLPYPTQLQSGEIIWTEDPTPRRSFHDHHVSRRKFGQRSFFRPCSEEASLTNEKAPSMTRQKGGNESGHSECVAPVIKKALGYTLTFHESFKIMYYLLRKTYLIGITLNGIVSIVKSGNETNSNVGHLDKNTRYSGYCDRLLSPVSALVPTICQKYRSIIKCIDTIHMSCRLSIKFKKWGDWPRHATNERLWWRSHLFQDVPMEAFGDNDDNDGQNTTTTALSQSNNCDARKKKPFFLDAPIVAVQ